MGKFDFFALISRMKYINRWGLMRNTTTENLAEHSHSVAIIAHALGVIKNTYFGGDINAERCATLALYHDASEIMTGDMPTPIKYYSSNIITAYKDIEKKANEYLASMLPEEMADNYKLIMNSSSEDEYLIKLVKAADKISAYIKCLEETKMGNHEFSSALVSTKSKIDAIELDEVRFFMDNFVKSFGLSLDELK